ncbi:MAG: glycine zipper 2TM domain-containing protein [Sphingomicrobium sp.]|nr:glycine zipper 2TM domain-containing protein [Sphingomonadales bacterium]
MFKKALLALSAASMVAIPATADAHRYRGYSNGYYSNGYDNGYYNNGYGYNGYNNGYYGQNAYYGQRAYNNGYYGRSYRDHRCSGTTGTIVGGAGGALLGRSIGRSRDYDGYRRGSGTTGTILGAAIGALVGREVGKSTC